MDVNGRELLVPCDDRPIANKLKVLKRKGVSILLVIGACRLRLKTRNQTVLGQDGRDIDIWTTIEAWEPAYIASC